MDNVLSREGIPLFSIIRDWELGVKRSSLWPKVRKEYLKKHPACECCGGKNSLEVHHEKPVHLFPELELEESNLMTLCERMKCHFVMGHLYSWKSYNPNVEEDLKVWNEKIANRPKG
jgi:hypothetical protein